MFVNTSKRLLRPQQIVNFRTFIKYSALAFYLSSNTSTSSFSLGSQVNKRSTPKYIAPKALFVQASPLFVHRGGSITPVKMTSTSTEAVASVEPTAEEKLNALRSKMKDLDLDVYIVPSDDPHLSEYVPPAYARRSFISGFGGSAGTAVIFHDEALLWTDSRYHNEANLQLDGDHWTLMKQGLPKVPPLTKYIADAAVKKYSVLERSLRVGIDPFVHPASFENELTDAFKAAVEKSDLSEDSQVGIIETLDGHDNLVDQVWGDSRPPMPTSPFRVHPLEFAGKSVVQKVDEIRDEMEEKKASLAVFSALDDIAYLFNVRTKGDIDFCPVGLAYGAISRNEVVLYCNDAKLASDDVKQHLDESGVTVKAYDALLDDIKVHIASSNDAKIWIDKTRSSYAITRIIPEKLMINSQSAVTAMKACKNKEEMSGMKRAHVVDGAAMAHFIAWLENEICNVGRSVSEVEIDEALTGLRAQQPGYVEDSFPTIAGVGSNGAIIHYRAKADSGLLQHLDKNNPILIDSGGQYTYGTTDVTRTWHFGEATAQFKENYTRVLKGNIGVDTMIFPTETPGFVLDVFARKSLWEAGMDYGHGTGHGVGAALNVHEGPHSISPRWANKEPMKKGMIVSNEPGLYEDGSFGIRIENLLECTYLNDEDNAAYDNGLNEGDDGFPEKPSGKKTFLKFNKLTMIPIQKNLIDIRLMTESELDWLDNYHEEIFAKVSPLLESDSPGLEWLTKACEKIDRRI